jgi:hypothetical protein
MPWGVGLPGQPSSLGGVTRVLTLHPAPPVNERPQTRELHPGFQDGHVKGCSAKGFKRDLPFHTPVFFVPPWLHQRQNGLD